MAHFYSKFTGTCTCGRDWVRNKCASETRLSIVGVHRWYTTYDPYATGVHIYQYFEDFELDEPTLVVYTRDE